MKYINIDGIGLITFPDTVDHVRVFKMFVPNEDHSIIIGAGKIAGEGSELVPDHINCYGESITLKCRCNKELDNAALRRELALW